MLNCRQLSWCDFKMRDKAISGSTSDFVLFGRVKQSSSYQARSLNWLDDDRSKSTDSSRKDWRRRRLPTRSSWTSCQSLSSCSIHLNQETDLENHEADLENLFHHFPRLRRENMLSILKCCLNSPYKQLTMTRSTGNLSVTSASSPESSEFYSRANSRSSSRWSQELELEPMMKIPPIAKIPNQRSSTSTSTSISISILGLSHSEQYDQTLNPKSIESSFLTQYLNEDKEEPFEMIKTVTHYYTHVVASAHVNTRPAFSL